MSKEYGLYIGPERLETIQTIKFIKQIGAVAILAHPLFKHTQDDLEELLPQAKAAGLDGIEVYYSTFTEQDTILAKMIADKYGLLYSGSSDFHGKNKPEINLGIGKGNLKIPYSLLTNFKTLSKKTIKIIRIKKKTVYVLNCLYFYLNKLSQSNQSCHLIFYIER